MAKTQNPRSEFMPCITLFLWISIIILFFPFPLVAKGNDGYLNYEIVFQEICQSDSPLQKIQGTVKRGGTRTIPTEGSPVQTSSTTDKTYSQLKEKKVTSAEGLETWTLTVTGVLTDGEDSTNTSGSATIKIDEKGNLSGSGNISVTDTSSDPRYSPAKGEGTFTFTGKREGDYLVLYFNKGNITCKGTRTYDTKTEPYERSYNPDLLGSGIVIKRKEGGTSTTNLKVSEVTHTVTYSLSGGQNVVKTRPPLQDVSTKKENIWTLEFERFLTTPYGVAIEEGSVEFTIQSGGGPVRAEGPMTVKGVGGFMKGVLMLDGKIEKNILAFNLRARIQTIHGPDGVAVSDFGEGQWWFTHDEPDSIPVKNGAEVIKNFSTSSTQSKIFFRLKGKKMEEKMEVRQITMDKKVEHWQITLDGFITCHSGGSPAPIPKPKDLPTGARSEILVKWSDAVCGLKVHWRIEIDVEIEDDEYKHGEGRCSIVSIDPFADPPGLYKSEPISVPIITADNRKMNTPFVEKPVFVVKKGTKNGRQLELDLYFQTNESEVLGYGVAYKCTLNEKEAEKKVEYWKEKKHKMPKEISEKLFEPFPYRINVLLVDGWSKSEGKAGSVTHEVVKVKRIIKDK